MNVELILLALLLVAALIIIFLLLLRQPKVDLNDRWAQLLGQQGQGMQQALARSEGAATVGVTEIVSREAAPAIIAYAEQNGYTHIVMGTGDKRGLQRLVLGSVASEVATRAHCTVTIAR